MPVIKVTEARVVNDWQTVAALGGPGTPPGLQRVFAIPRKATARPIEPNSYHDVEAEPGMPVISGAGFRGDPIRLAVLIIK